jgi:DNA-binding FrmR family transcriptional regulator
MRKERTTEMDSEAAVAESGAPEARRGPHPVNQSALRRLKSIEGQVRGIQRMVEEEQYCVDIVNQISAVRSALNGVGVIVLRRHIENCVSDAIRNGGEGGSAIIEELMTLLSRNQF